MICVSLLIIIITVVIPLVFRYHGIALLTFFQLKVGWRLSRHIKLLVPTTNVVLFILTTWRNKYSCSVKKYWLSYFKWRSLLTSALLFYILHIYIYIYTYIYVICIYLYIHLYLYICIYLYKYNIYIYIYIYIFVFIYAIKKQFCLGNRIKLLIKAKLVTGRLGLNMKRVILNWRLLLISTKIFGFWHFYQCNQKTLSSQNVKNGLKEINLHVNLLQEFKNTS